MPLSKHRIASFENNGFKDYRRKNGFSFIRKVYFNKNITSFIKTVSQLLIIDIIFITFNIYVNKYILSSLKRIFMLVINIAMTYSSLLISRKLDICSSELVSNLEKKINFDILEAGSSSQKLLNLEIQCLNSFRLIENGIISSVHLLFYPIRFGIFGYIFFNSNWSTFLFMNKVIELLLVTTIFESLRIKVLIIPEQKSILAKISDYLDSLKALLLLSNHREVFINSPKTSNDFTKVLLNYVFVILQSTSTMYLVFRIVRFFNENSHKLDLSQICMFNYWSVIYLLYSTRYINSCILFIINYKYVCNLLQISKNTRLNYNCRSQEISYFDKNYQELDKNEISETLINFKDSSKEFKMQKNYDILDEKHSLICNNHDNSNNKCHINYLTLKKASDKISIISNGTNYDNKNNIVLGKNEKSNYKGSNFLFNPVIISYKNLSLLVSYENKHEKLIQNSSNKFNFLSNLFGKKIRQAKFLNYHCNNNLDINNNELMEDKFYLNNINLSIKINEIIIIFGSGDKDKELLTKFISGFSGIKSNEQLECNSTNIFNNDTYLINRNMLEFVSNLFEYQESESAIDPFDFILSGKPFNKNIFELIYDSLLCEYFTKNEFSYESGKRIKNYIYPKIESVQQFVEAKIFLQLSQFFYNILTKLDSHSSAIVIIDGIFELLLPATYIKLVEKILPNNSIFSEFNISFIITTNSDLLPYLSYLYDNNSFVKLAMINTKGLYFIKDNYLNLGIKEKFVENLPSIDNTINEIFNINLKSINTYPCSKSISFISKLYFKRLETGNFYSSKYLIYLFFIALFSFTIKLIVFSSKHLAKNHNSHNSIYDFFVFEILSFCPLYSSVGTSTYFYSNGLSNILMGYATISSIFLNFYSTPLFSEINSLKNNGRMFNDKRVDNFMIPKFLVTPEKNYNSSYFIQLNGKQILKTTSSFYKDHFINSNVINIPGIKSKGFNNAIISSKQIQNILKQKSKKKSNIKLLQKYEQFPIKQNLNFKFNKSLILTITLFFVINIISMIFIYILIFGFSIININSLSYYNCLREFSRIVLSSEDPISVINDIEIRKNKYFLYLFKEIYNKRNKITIHYLNLIQSFSLLFFFGISNNLNSNFGIGELMNKNLLIITILFPILYNIIKFLNFNRKKVKYSSIRCNSFDYYYYLNKSNSLSWFRDQTSKLLELKLENLKEFLNFKLILLINSLILSITASYLYFLFNYKTNENNQQLTIDLIIFLPIIFFLIQSVYFHIIEGSKTNISPKLNFFSFLRQLKTSIQKAYYFPIYINKSANSTSPKTDIRFLLNNEDSILNEDGYELSTPISGASLKMDQILSISSIKVQLNSNIVFSLINPLLFLDNSLTFGYGKSPLFPIKQLRTVNANNLDRIAVVSNHNLISSYWTINMVLDPKGIYANDNKRLLHTLKSLNIFPKIFNDLDPNIILSITIREYLKLVIPQVVDGNAVFTNGIKTMNFERDIKVPDSCKLDEHKSETDGNLQHDMIYIKKLLLFGHFTLYSMYFKELILHLDYDMDLNVWISLVKQFFDNERSSINNIIIISTDAGLSSIDNT
ncbi:integral membrane with 12 or more transmembrane domains [Cryptosporidium sp. chipmunk genotype I]|uniref:integral membrane with 12 or more transmembrane domains n=1 Tax=Cryptosporidium sp. chipmunk genotype I TaxID=1280935 RepID=UPI00351A93AD|nr:integral membrane with 12 or more transmembrane domains [Cryptosporidium sp. chipmunk genotype I]